MIWENDGGDTARYTTHAISGLDGQIDIDHEKGLVTWKDKQFDLIQIVAEWLEGFSIFTSKEWKEGTK